MKKISLTILLVVFLSLNSSAQKGINPTLEDFVGTWALDEEKSFIDSKLRENFEDFTLIISYKEPEIKILQSYLFKGKLSEYTITLWIDKRGEDNTYASKSVDGNDNNYFYWIEDLRMKSKSYFKNGRIIREGSYKRENFARYPVIIKETYSLSKDGKTMTIMTDITIVTTNNSSDPSPDSSSISPISSKAIYHKR